jgi:hypothetical protein
VGGPSFGNSVAPAAPQSFDFRPTGPPLGNPVDPFGNLGPVLKSSLPAATPTPSAFPSQQPALPPQPQAPAASVPSYSAPAAASMTLFGMQATLTGYDLSAPAAPKPHASGNPFA